MRRSSIRMTPRSSIAFVLCMTSGGLIRSALPTMRTHHHRSSSFLLFFFYATSPIETEVCATVTGGCGMDFLPSSRTKDDYGVKSISAINAEKVKIDIDMFRITNADITDATIAAFKRGVPVRMIVDASEYSNPNRVWVRYNVDRLFAAGVPLKITRHGGQNHEKAVLLYGQGLTIWGSSNWS